MTYTINDDEHRRRVTGEGDPYTTRREAAEAAVRLRRDRRGARVRVVDLATERWIAEQVAQGEQEMGA